MINFIKTTSCFRNSIRKLNGNKWYKIYSTQPITVEKEELNTKQQELIERVERLSNINKRVRIKKPQKPPFMKNVFHGIYDTDILTYPELHKIDYEALNKKVEPLETYFNELKDDATKCGLDLNGEFTENLRKLKVFGLECSQLLDGQDLTLTETCRFNDVLASATSGFPGLLYSEQLGIQTLLKIGTEAQRKKYLPQLIAGKSFAAYCISEPNLYDFSKMQTAAELEPGKKFWILNGEKDLIVNGGIADLFVVIAGTGKLDRFNKKQTHLTAFLVEKNFGGISTSPCDTSGIHGTNVENVTFKNTPIPVENLLGNINRGDHVVKVLMDNFRLTTGSACTSIAKKLLNNLINTTTHITVSDKMIAESDHVRSKISQLSTLLYAMESMTYLTSQLMDEYENQDCELEAAIVKVFTSQEAVNSTVEAMQLIGNKAYFKNHWCNVLHQDALSHLILDESSENLKLKIALLGLQYAGMQGADDIRKRRNPLYNPLYVFKKMWEYRHQMKDNPKLTLHLEDYVHPSCSSIYLLEYSVLRLKFGIEHLLATYGIEAMNKHMDLLRIGECAIDIYAMTACLARASRAYCIGLRNADIEMLLAMQFCQKAKDRVQYKINEIVSGPVINADDTRKTVAKRKFKFGRYCVDHPLTRNY